MKKTHEVKVVPRLDEEILYFSDHTQSYIKGTVVYVNLIHNYYTLEFEGKAGKYRMSFKPGGGNMRDYRKSPHPAYVKRFRRAEGS